jgi:hypothetical protein
MMDLFIVALSDVQCVRVVLDTLNYLLFYLT